MTFAGSGLITSIFGVGSLFWEMDNRDSDLEAMIELVSERVTATRTDLRDMLQSLNMEMDDVESRVGDKIADSERVAVSERRVLERSISELGDDISRIEARLDTVSQRLTQTETSGIDYAKRIHEGNRTIAEKVTAIHKLLTAEVEGNRSEVEPGGSGTLARRGGAGRK